MPTPKRYLRDLYKLFATVRTEKEAKMLLNDMLTPKELNSLAERWQIVQMLSKKIPQRTIVKKLPVSISKVTRGSHVLQEGTGGVKHFLKKLRKSKKARTRDPSSQGFAEASAAPALLKLQ